MDLQLASNQELIEELTSRSTFLGVVVGYDGNYKDQDKICLDDFRIQARRIPPEVAVELFQFVADDIRDCLESGDILYHDEPEDEV